MARKTRKNKRNNHNRRKTHSRRGGTITTLALGASLDEVAQKVNDIIDHLNSQNGNATPNNDNTGTAAAQSRKKKGKRKLNPYFKRMIEAKKKKSSSFTYNGNTYRAEKGGNAGQLTVYKKA